MGRRQLEKDSALVAKGHGKVGRTDSHDRSSSAKRAGASTASAAMAIFLEAIGRGQGVGPMRRSLKLSCGDLAPHDDNASEGCLALETDVSPRACPNYWLEGSLYRDQRPATADHTDGGSSGIYAAGALSRGGVISLAIAHIKPTSSRETAVMATFGRFPRPRSLLSCARSTARRARGPDTPSAASGWQSD